MSTPSPFSISEVKRYSRQLILPQISFSGQSALKKSHALIVGLGGLGSPSSLYLTAAGIGKITLVDFDVVELSNLQRQIVHQQKNLGMNKAESAKKMIAKVNPNVIVHTLEHKLDLCEWEEAISQVDIVLDCSDNFDTRYQINRACHQQKTPLVSASVIAFEGQLCCFDFSNKGSACYACIFPEDAHVSIGNCSESGVFAAAAGTLGVMQAAEALKYLMGLNVLNNQLLIINSLTWEQKIIKIQPDLSCPVCSPKN